MQYRSTLLWGSAALWDSLSHGEERHFQQEPPLYPVAAILIRPFCTSLSLSICRSQTFQTGLKSVCFREFIRFFLFVCSSPTVRMPLIYLEELTASAPVFCFRNSLVGAVQLPGWWSGHSQDEKNCGTHRGWGELSPVLQGLLVAAAAGEVRAAPVPTWGSGKAVLGVSTRCRIAASFPLLCSWCLPAPLRATRALAHNLCQPWSDTSSWSHFSQTQARMHGSATSDMFLCHVLHDGWLSEGTSAPLALVIVLFGTWNLLLVLGL